MCDLFFASVSFQINYTDVMTFLIYYITHFINSYLMFVGKGNFNELHKYCI
jgi:hypothetical protein